MTLEDAHKKVQELNANSTDMVYFVTRDPYTNEYKIEFEPVQLSIVKTQLKYQTGYNLNFNKRSKYGSSY